MEEAIPMKKSCFTEAQIMGVLRLAEGGLAVPELCRKQGIGGVTPAMKLKLAA
jgi:putative transposase